MFHFSEIYSTTLHRHPKHHLRSFCFALFIFQIKDFHGNQNIYTANRKVFFIFAGIICNV